MKLAVFIVLVLILLGLSFGARHSMDFASPNDQLAANLTPANPDTGPKGRTIMLRSAKCEFQWAIDRLDGGGQMQCVPIGSQSH
jgi:hypothetical protein